MLDWVGGMSMDSLDYVARETILFVAYYVAMQYYGQDLTFHSIEHKLYFFTVVTPLILVFLQIQWFQMMVTMPYFVFLWMSDWFYFLIGTNDESEMESADDTIDGAPKIR